MEICLDLQLEIDKCLIRDTPLEGISAPEILGDLEDEPDWSANLEYCYRSKRVNA